jgi:hypothetical protein
VRAVWFAAFALAVFGGPVGAQQAKPPAPKKDKVYLIVDLDQLRRFPENYKGKDVRISDRFDSVTTIYPRTLQRKEGLTADKVIEFHTADSNGSNMTCYVKREDKEAVSLVDNLGRFAPVTLEGTVYGVVNTMTIFLVDHLYSGYEVPKKTEKPEIKMIMQWEGDSKKYTYIISQPGQFVLTDPTTNKKISVEFKY